LIAWVNAESTAQQATQYDWKWWKIEPAGTTQDVSLVNNIYTISNYIL